MDIKKFNLKWTSSLTALRNFGYDIPWETVIAKYLSKFPNANRDLFDLFSGQLESTRNMEIVDHAEHGGGGGKRFQPKNQGNTSGSSVSGEKTFVENNQQHQKNKQHQNSNQHHNKSEKSTAYILENNPNSVNPEVASTDVPNVSSVTSVNAIVRSTYPAQKLKPLSVLLSLPCNKEDPSLLEQLRTHDTEAYSTMVSSRCTLLDSACKNHIVNECSLFFSYDSMGSLDVQTANAGILSTSTSGTCYFRVPLDGSSQFLVLELIDCLHAPEAPVNLISLGAMLKNGFSFKMDSSTVEIYPDGIPHHAVADIVRRLCVMRGNFIDPKDGGASAPLPIAMPVFVPQIPNGSLFHE
ncbi:hypothetical protein F5878DRAFT_662666 [Lentinula raphanica]|uniref:Retrovirus-related Pol polyprotein from transposon TNT 1-94-like beta-barrel domain-containing protein n=1 Tax=Lentinula raphanica TaxID=153919 RepID=A0AA38P656_9AGAR|nr:hypothetical protein F5878DRAFT_662666 [Lentinula raphanica]